VSNIRYSQEIDGLRAVAVLAVVFFHAGFGPGAGYVGVDIFFVISGYLITSLLHNEWSTTGRIDLTAFYARRVKRILPAMLVVIVATVTASTLLLSPNGEVTEVARSAAASLTFAANFFFQANTGGYFASASDRMPLLHLWSLAVEEQFYLVWPIALLILMRWGRARTRSVLACVALASISLAELLIFLGSNAAFYQMPARLWELSAGGLIALSPTSKLTGGGRSVALGMAILALAIAIPIEHFPGLGALPAVVGTTAVLLGVHAAAGTGFAGSLLCTRPMTFIGRISYSLYTMALAVAGPCQCHACRPGVRGRSCRNLLRRRPPGNCDVQAGRATVSATGLINIERKAGCCQFFRIVRLSSGNAAGGYRSLQSAIA